MTDQPDSLAAALAILQTRLPHVGKDTEGQAGTRRYKYADLHAASKVLLPELGKLGLSFSARPTMSAGEFVLAYELLHTSGESRGGEYPLGKGNPQLMGGLITYARRYCLFAVTGATAAEDDDDAQEAANAEARPAARPRRPREPLGKPPERAPAELPRNADGSISRSQATDEELAAAGLMTSQQQREHSKLRKDAQEGAVNGVTRHDQADPDDQWATPPLRAPRAARDPAQVIATHFSRLGVTDRDERLKATARLARRDELATTKDLTAAEGARVKGLLEKCRDRSALIALLAEEVVDA